MQKGFVIVFASGEICIIPLRDSKHTKGVTMQSALKSLRQCRKHGYYYGNKAVKAGIIPFSHYEEYWNEVAWIWES